MLNGSYFAIPAGGKLVLTIETEPYDKTASNGVYYNEATITPTQSYNDDAVTSGRAVSAKESSSGQPYVSSSDFVFVNGGYSTSSQKWIQNIKDESTDTTKIANSETDNSDGVRYIVLDDEKETFRYTLEVTNNLSSTMDNLVVVDVLPESGDYALFTVQNPKTARNSEFQVDLLLDDSGGDGTVEWEVVIGTKKEISGNAGDTAAGDTITVTKTLERVYLDGNYKTTETSGYVIYYSTCSDFTDEGTKTNVGMTINDYADLDAKYADGNRVWTTNPKGARAIRIEILDSISSKTAVQISFNAKVSDSATGENAAEPGEIAWNSFAYRYSTTITSNGESKTETLWAAPRKVEVKIPDVPKLKKTLSNFSGNEEYVTSDQVFRFPVHEGEKLSDTIIDYTTCTEAELIEALNQSGDKREYFVIELTVPYITEGSKEAEISLDPESALVKSDGDFVYVAGNTYTIVELPKGSTQSGNQDFTCKYMSDSVSGKTVETNVISFKYTSGDDYILVSAVNTFSQEEGSYELPITGGSGKELYTLLGLALLCGAGLTFCWHRNKRRVL